MKNLLIGLFVLASVSVSASSRSVDICLESVSVLKKKSIDLSIEEEQTFQQCFQSGNSQESCEKYLRMNQSSKKLLKDSAIEIEQYCQQKYGQELQHPDDNELMYNIGRGTKIEFLKDIKIIPNQKFVRLGDICVIEMRKPQKFDRLLAAGSVLIVTDTNWRYSNSDALIVDNANISEIICRTKHGEKPTINDLKESGKELFQLILADPMRI